MIDYFNNLGGKETIVFCTTNEHNILLPILDDLGYRWSDNNERIICPKYPYNTYYNINHSDKDKNYLNYAYFLLTLFSKHLLIILVKEFN